MTDKRVDHKLFQLVKHNCQQSLQDITFSFNRTEPVRVRKMYSL